METVEPMSEKLQQAEAKNQQQLTTAMEQLKNYLSAIMEKNKPAFELSDSCPTLAALSTIFGLSDFEQRLLLWCAGIELDSELATLTDSLHGTATAANGPTFAMALGVLPNAYWSALTPSAPLRYWRLLDWQPGSTLTQRVLRINERILHYLTGIQYLDEELMHFVQPVVASWPLLPSQETLASQITKLWSRPSDSRVPAVQLISHDIDNVLAVASAVATNGSAKLFLLDGNLLPIVPHELELFQRLWEREVFLSGSLLLLKLQGVEMNDSCRRSAVWQFCERLNTPFLISAPERLTELSHPLVSFELKRPDEPEQQLLWERTLGSTLPALKDDATQLASQFTLSASAIQNAVRAVSGNETGAAEHLWDACRHQARPAMDGLVQRVETRVTWDDLILPEREKAILQDIATQLRHRHRVYSQWGFSSKTARGLGISALFAGPSGTGKTLAAEVIANALQLDLYKIDLSQVVSKYIGETEKNLSKIFDAAEAGGAILLFDEADALFGKRSEVKDSHDRYANIEVSYLLQRMEAYRGLAILTTNMKQAMDNAFLRRLRFIVNFRFPDVVQRVQIWQCMFPAEAPIKNLNWDKLAQLNVTGGNIRNITVNAAFYAAADNSPIQMRHILRSARAEYDKLDRPLSGTEIRGWT